MCVCTLRDCVCVCEKCDDNSNRSGGELNVKKKSTCFFFFSLDWNSL